MRKLFEKNGQKDFSKLVISPISSNYFTIELA